MSRLIYGIVREQAAAGLNLAARPGGSAVSMVKTHGIAAASAAVIEHPSTEDLPSVLAFAQVVSALHAQCDVLPVRYGTCAASERDIEEMLTLRAGPFRAALDVIEGCEEMGVRVVWNTVEIDPDEPSREIAQQSGAERLASDVPHATCARSGTEYLARLRARYQEREASARRKARAIETVQDAFAGRFVRFQADETADADRGVLSLHFLTRRCDRERFVRAFDEFRDRCLCRLLLTGPWPPYHFSAALSNLDLDVANR